MKNARAKPGRKTIISENAGNVIVTSKTPTNQLLIWQFSNTEE